MSAAEATIRSAETTEALRKRWPGAWVRVDRDWTIIRFGGAMGRFDAWINFVPAPVPEWIGQMQYVDHRATTEGHSDPVAAAEAVLAGLAGKYRAEARRAIESAEQLEALAAAPTPDRAADKRAKDLNT